MSEPGSARSEQRAAAGRPRRRGVLWGERRGFVLAGAVLFGIIAVLGVVITFTTPDGPRRDTNAQLQEQGGAKPHIIPRPSEGTAPTDSGDRGGWLQLGLAGLLFASVLGGMGWLAWWSRRAKLGKGRPARSLARRPRTNA